jgi:hypothetical protein
MYFDEFFWCFFESGPILYLFIANWTLFLKYHFGKDNRERQ